MRALATAEYICRYERDGVVLIRHLLDETWLEVLASGIEYNTRNRSKRTVDYVDEPVNGGRFFYDARIVGEVEAYDRVMLHSPMAQTAAELMRSSRAIAFYISVFVRGHGTKNRSPWHQDQVTWSAEGGQACSAWVSVDPVPGETALEFVAGSHRWETEYRPAPFFSQTYEQGAGLPVFPDIQNHREDYDIVSWEMAPGDCLFFHGMTAHGGSGDLPDGLGRRAVSVQWLGDDTRFRLLPHGDNPPISENLLEHGVEPGEPIVCDICPVAYQHG